jgi:hypothetical protein
MSKMYSPIRNAAMEAAQDRTQRMPFSMSMPAMCMAAAAAANTILLETGVITSVSSFVTATLISLITLLLLVVLVVLISLILTGLTGLVGLESLVGLTNEAATTYIQVMQGE